MTALPAEDDARDELAEIASALRAYVEWQQASGASGLPRDLEAKERVLRQAQQVAQRDAGLSETERPRAPSSTLSSSALSSSTNVEGPGEQDILEPGGAPAPTGSVLLDLPTTLPLLQERVRTCTACELSRERTNTVFARGSTKSGLCFVGEGPGADEDVQGLPFVGKAGQLLDKMISAMGFDRDDVYVMNIVKCRPPNNRKPSPQEMGACSQFLHRQLELANPEIIVALGATAVEGLLGESGGITRIRGRFRLYRGQVAVMPTFHPAYLLRNPAAKRDVWSDLRQVVHHMGRTLPQPPVGG